MILDTHLIHAAVPSLGATLEGVLLATGEEPLDEWLAGALEIVVATDPEGRATALNGGASPADAQFIARTLAKQTGRDVDLLTATVRTSFTRNRLTMDADLRRSVLRASGALEHVAAPTIESDELTYEDSEPRLAPLHAMDELIAASNFGSEVVLAARSAAGLPFSYAVASSRRSYKRRSASPGDLPVRLRVLADAILAGASWSSNPEPLS